MSSTFTTSPGWLDWDPEPSVPAFALPAGTVDAHCHVFGPGDEFPFAPERKYTPCDAGKDQLFALRDHLGFEPQRRSCRPPATARTTARWSTPCARRGGRARGVATVRPDVTDAELRELDEAGVRGVRFNFVRRLVDAAPTRRAGGDRRAHRAARLARRRLLRGRRPARSWGTSSARCRRRSWSTTWAAPTSRKPVDGPEFEPLPAVRARARRRLVKVSCPERLTVTGPPALDGERNAYRDVVPFARRVVEEFPDRVLWGTDWPHPNLTDHMPDDGLLVDHVPHIAVTPEQRQKLLVDNPMRLYWPDERP